MRQRTIRLIDRSSPGPRRRQRWFGSAPVGSHPACGLTSTRFGARSATRRPEYGTAGRPPRTLRPPRPPSCLAVTEGASGPADFISATAFVSNTPAAPRSVFYGSPSGVFCERFRPGYAGSPARGDSGDARPRRKTPVPPPRRRALRATPPAQLVAARRGWPAPTRGHLADPGHTPVAWIERGDAAPAAGAGPVGCRPRLACAGPRYSKARRACAFIDDLLQVHGLGS